MARLICSAQRALISSVSFFETRFHGLRPQNSSSFIQSRVPSSTPPFRFRSCATGDVTELPSETFKSFNVDFHPGEYKITLNKRFGDSEHIRIEVVLYGFTRQTEPPDGMYSRYRIYFNVYISKEDCPDELKLVCKFEETFGDEGCLDIQRVYMASCDNKLPCNHRGPYIWSLFSSERWLELRRTFKEFLKARGVSDEMYPFLNQQLNLKEKSEYDNWLQSVDSHLP
ncbi:hypothetical protein EZV62_013603 [Acer yangbiense]|uniref:Mitochondrial glycoprotein domain-containing protein n=1 Tax=Acer yangbiense TaxID=1000413 RepID=A0A5C7HZ59_9ROSI|nr:hypothetical protein EZV62_013603 [Acer yangbiense]